jgi:hypothetical protein
MSKPSHRYHLAYFGALCAGRHGWEWRWEAGAWLWIILPGGTLEETVACRRRNQQQATSKLRPQLLNAVMPPANWSRGMKRRNIEYHHLYYSSSIGDHRSSIIINHLDKTTGADTARYNFQSLLSAKASITTIPPWYMTSRGGSQRGHRIMHRKTGAMGLMAAAILMFPTWAHAPWHVDAAAAVVAQNF